MSQYQQPYVVDEEQAEAIFSSGGPAEDSEPDDFPPSPLLQPSQPVPSQPSPRSASPPASHTKFPVVEAEYHPRPAYTPHPRRVQLTTIAGVVSAFVDFLEACIHTLLCERQIYPLSLFIAARKYGTVVRQCIVPKVCVYIRDTVEQVSTELLRGSVKNVSIVILSEETNRPLERFCFDVENFPSGIRRVEKMAMLLMRNGDGQEEDGTEEDTAKAWEDVEEGAGRWADLEQQFKSAMVSLTAIAGSRPAITEECTWSTAIEMREDEVPAKQNTDWLMPEWQHEGEERKRDSGTRARSRGVRSTTIRNVKAGALQMSIYFEQLADKGKAKAI